MAALPLTENSLHRVEMEYHGKFGHTIGWIQTISPMSRTDICYTEYNLENQTMASTIPGFQGITSRIKYLSSHLHKVIFYPFNSYDGSNVIRLTWSGNQV